MPLFMDTSIAQRLERVEARANASLVEARARLMPDVGATWIDVGGTYAMFDGPGSPMTQTFGLGLHAEATAESFDRLEAFFESRGAEVHHETSPLAGVGLFAALVDRGYRPNEVSTVLVHPLENAPPAVPPHLGVRLAEPSERDRWVETSVAGWGTNPEAAEFLRGFGKVLFEGEAMLNFFAENEGRAIATAGLAIHDGTALLAGASTVPEHRGRGAQNALLAGRLAHARAAGCDLAMMATAPGSDSQRNAERNGFRVAYTRIKWKLERR